MIRIAFVAVSAFTLFNSFFLDLASFSIRYGISVAFRFAPFIFDYFLYRFICNALSPSLV